MTLRRNHLHERGTSLITALLLVMIAVGLCAAVMTTLTSRAELTRASRAGMVAIEVADSGLAAARAELLANVDPDGDGIGAVSGKVSGSPFKVSCTKLDATHYRLVSTGRADGTFRSLESMVEVTDSTQTVFAQGFFGDQSVAIGSGSTADAYDSALGAYAAQAVNFDARGNAFALSSARIGSNGQVSILGANTALHGDVVPGVSDVVTFAGGALVNGSTAPREQPLVLPVIDQDDIRVRGGALRPSATDLTRVIAVGAVTINNGDITVGAGGIAQLPTGVYHVNSIRLTNGGVLKIAGDVRLYIAHELDAAGGEIQTASQTPSSLQVFGLGDDSVNPADVMKVSVAKGVFAAIYAPKMTIQFNGRGGFFGAAVARQIQDAGRNNFHFDSALARLPGSSKPRTVKQITWWPVATPVDQKNL